MPNKCRSQRQSSLEFSWVVNGAIRIFLVWMIERLCTTTRKRSSSLKCIVRKFKITGVEWLTVDVCGFSNEALLTRLAAHFWIKYWWIDSKIFVGIGSDYENKVLVIRSHKHFTDVFCRTFLVRFRGKRRTEVLTSRGTFRNEKISIGLHQSWGKTCLEINKE